MKRASPEDIKPQLNNVVTLDAVVYHHPLTYDTTPTTTRHRHQVYAHVPQRRHSSGPTFQQAELSKHTQMNREFPLNSEPRTLFNPPLVACREIKVSTSSATFARLPWDRINPRKR